MIYDNPRSRSFIDLCPRSLRYIWNFFSSKTIDHLKPNFMWSLHGMLGWKCFQMLQVTWPGWLPVIYGKNFQKSLSSEPRDWWPWNLVYSILYSGTTKFIQMMTQGWPWPFLWHGQICFLMLLHGWKLVFPSLFSISLHSGEQYRTNGPLVSKLGVVVKLTYPQQFIW